MERKVSKRKKIVFYLFIFCITFQNVLNHSPPSISPLPLVFILPSWTYFNHDNDEIIFIEKRRKEKKN